jgi:hypothetical protein
VERHKTVPYLRGRELPLHGRSRDFEIPRNYKIKVLSLSWLKRHLDMVKITGSSPVGTTKRLVTVKGFTVGRKRVMGSRPIPTSNGW